MDDENNELREMQRQSAAHRRDDGEKRRLPFSPNALTQEQTNEAKEKIRQEYGGPANAGVPMVLGGGKVKPVEGVTFER